MGEQKSPARGGECAEEDQWHHRDAGVEPEEDEQRPCRWSEGGEEIDPEDHGDQCQVVAHVPGLGSIPVTLRGAQRWRHRG